MTRQITGQFLLTCICCKTLAHILVSKIMQHLSEHDTLVETQHGFRSGRSFETQLVQFIYDLRENLDGAHNRGHKQTDLIIMYFAKAFDKVPYRRLAYKLEYYCIRNDILQWITTWLSGRTQKVVIDGVSSDTEPVLSGVTQSSVLGPILSFFLIFINDIPDNINSTGIWLYQFLIIAYLFTLQSAFLQMTVSFNEILEGQRTNKYARMTWIN